MDNFCVITVDSNEYIPHTMSTVEAAFLIFQHNLYFSCSHTCFQAGITLMFPWDAALPSSFPLYFSYFILTTCPLFFQFPAYKLEQLLSVLHTFSPHKLFKSGISPWDSLVFLLHKSVIAGKKANALN